VLARGVYGGRQLTHQNVFGGLKVKPGSKNRSFIEAGPYFLHKRAWLRQYVRIPFTVICGSRQGPTLCVTAGVHGTEYAGIEAAARLANELKPEDLIGTLIVVPLVNGPAFKERTYNCPIDGVNLQGNFPGKLDGSIGQTMIYKLFKELVSKADYYLDLHGADSHESERCHAGFYVTGIDDIDKRSQDMARHLGFKYVLRYMTGECTGSSWRVAPENGIPSALCECGQGDRLLPEEASGIMEGVLNVMGYLKMVGGIPKETGEQNIISSAKICVNSSGMFHMRVQVGDILEKGDLIGEVKDLEGRVLETVCAPSRGVVLLTIHNPVVELGEKLMTFGYL